MQRFSALTTLFFFAACVAQYLPFVLTYLYGPFAASGVTTRSIVLGAALIVVPPIAMLRRWDAPFYFASFWLAGNNLWVLVLSVTSVLRGGLAASGIDSRADFLTGLRLDGLDSTAAWIFLATFIPMLVAFSGYLIAFVIGNRAATWLYRRPSTERLGGVVRVAERKAWVDGDDGVRYCTDEFDDISAAVRSRRIGRSRDIAGNPLGLFTDDRNFAVDGTRVSFVPQDNTDWCGVRDLRVSRSARAKNRRC
jgi:hypothetical protein